MTISVPEAAALNAIVNVTRHAGAKANVKSVGASHDSSEPVFASPDDEPIAYRKRTREYYEALGYPPYIWAHYADVPFHPLKKPLSQCRVALVTTAAPYRPDRGDQGPGAPYNAAAKFFDVYSGETVDDPDVRVSHVAIDRDHTTAADPGTYFPLKALRRALAKRMIGEVSPRFHGLPTNRSQRVTLETDCPDLVARCIADGVDAAVLVPNCPVCHQTCALAARALEAAGIATVLMGCAKDIVEHVGVPRFLFSDFPLGNAAGRPHDETSQDFTLALALRILEQAPAARTTVQSPLRWSSAPDWKRDYCNVERLSAEEIATRQRQFRADKAVANGLRERSQQTRS